MQIGFMDAPKHSQIGPQRGTGSFTGIAMDLAFAVSIVIARPLICAMADRRMFRNASWIAGRLIGVQHRATSRDILVNQFVARPLICMATYPETMLAALA